MLSILIEEVQDGFWITEERFLDTRRYVAKDIHDVRRRVADYICYTAFGKGIKVKWKLKEETP